jgi:phage baseplate assembly protein W
MAKKRYSDLDLDFIPHPISGDITIKYDENAVKRSIRNLIFTATGEKLFHPEIKSNLRNFLFDNFVPRLFVQIQMEIRDIITNYEPRAEIKDVVVIQSPDQNVLNVTVMFRVVGMPNITTMNFPLERLR